MPICMFPARCANTLRAYQYVSFSGSWRGGKFIIIGSSRFQLMRNNLPAQMVIAEYIISRVDYPFCAYDTNGTPRRYIWIVCLHIEIGNPPVFECRIILRGLTAQTVRRRFPRLVCTFLIKTRRLMKNFDRCGSERLYSAGSPCRWTNDRRAHLRSLRVCILQSSRERV